MATGTSTSQSALSPAFPHASRLNERGRLEVGGCDTIELAREHGTPAYIVAEDDLRARARAFVEAGRQTGHADFNVVFASKSFPCTAVLSLFADEGLWCDVASAGELHLALNAGFEPERIVLHGNAKSESELRMALRAGVGLIVIDNLDEIDRLARLVEQFHPAHAQGGEAAHARPQEEPHAAPPTGSHATPSGAAHVPPRPPIEGRMGPSIGQHAPTGPQDVLIRVTPDVRGETHDHISTGQADSKFGFAMADAPEAIARIEGVPGLRLAGLHAHIGSQLLELEPFRREVAELARLGEFGVWDLGGGLGVQYTADQPAPPAVDDYVSTLVGAAREHGMGEPGRRLLIEPGRSLVANACVTLYTVESVKRNVSRWVGVDGGMSDNLRPMLYGARYEAHVADRPGGLEECVLAGKHCESGDVIVRSALLDDPRPGDVIVTPATGAYGHAMASNYNGVPRPPVIFCSGGHARVVVRRETLEDLSARDV
jgi:diaminopimelate decarboxylase